MRADTARALDSLRRRLGRLLRAELDIELLSDATRPGQAFRSFASPNICVLDVQGDAIDIRKSASSDQSVHMLRLVEGVAELVLPDGSVQLRAGQYVAYRGGQALQFRHEQRVSLLNVMMPAQAVERWLPDWQAAELVVTEARADGRLSFEIARDLLQCSSQLQDDTAATLVGETVARLAARALSDIALHGAAAPCDLREAQRRRVRQFCRRHLASTQLTVDLVARALGMSRAALHRLFADQPHTLMQWVQLERLEACKRLLDELDPNALPRRTLTDIALSQGFKSSAHFSASFRARYGLRPLDYRNGAAANTSAS
jgi:AraC-like DNA-binding protein